MILTARDNLLNTPDLILALMTLPQCCERYQLHVHAASKHGTLRANIVCVHVEELRKQHLGKSVQGL